MINELDVPGTALWKYVDDTTISETISKNKDSFIQAAVDTLARRATEDKFQLNETKCKELLINFSTNNLTSFDPVVVNGMPIDLVTSAKILGLNISNDLKWNCHIDSIIKKAKKRLYSLSQLKCSGLGTRELVQSLFSAPVFVRSQNTLVLSFMTASPCTSPTNLKEYKSGLCASFFLFAHITRPWLHQALLNFQSTAKN